MLRSLLHSIAERLPSQCAVCRSWPTRPLCDACITGFAQPLPRCLRCALPWDGPGRTCGRCLRESPALDACVAAVPYAYPWSGLIIDFKFHGRPGRAAALADVMRHAPWAEPALEQADWLVPIPLSASRLKARGFNQALELARALVPAKTCAGSLLRIQDTSAQSGLPREQRLRNLRTAFAVAPEQVAGLRDRRILLIDDVMTTGATLDAAATCLRGVGAAHIGALVLARAQWTPDRPASG